jgi:hypothetical protein
MPYETYGWTFKRATSRIWSELEGPAKSRHGLGPRLGAHRRKRAVGSSDDEGRLAS